MTVTQLIRGSVVVLAVLALLTGCGGSAGGSGGAADTGSAAGPSSGTDAGSTAAADAGSNPDAGTSSPAAEGSGPESPQPAQGGGPSITVASLPVGGAGTPDPNNPDQQCGSVNWLLGSLPSDVVIELGDISLNPDGIFRLGGSGCPSDQPICGSATRWTTGSSGCGVPVIQLDPNSDATATIEVAGTVHCASQAECDQLAEQLKGASGSQATVTAVPHGSSSSDSSSSGSSGGSSSDQSSSSESASGPPGS